MLSIPFVVVCLTLAIRNGPAGWSPAPPGLLGHPRRSGPRSRDRGLRARPDGRGAAAQLRRPAPGAAAVSERQQALEADVRAAVRGPGPTVGRSRGRGTGPRPPRVVAGETPTSCSSRPTWARGGRQRSQPKRPLVLPHPLGLDVSGEPRR
ncbi:hypothetical protein HBB16_14910 [Pseudonocardia sp. MCCB 268]|nr:hypothetical protein [Pseudonocardia cytotoxica]